ncbi:pilus assembly protein [Oscillochloris sp. ZM17-4]|uniref:TadE/TadG family type IV pilus assembly protein n=1 Tax=Oscillochloris sp. ZM17-4 TaxID=2866714 RepID=UPI001C73C9A3|nr:TadE/TadG family type IV pilus assembly protein [Oscillochloris sp. ZM17-4]MBX0330269.1 pilus assembly protein [Oscillochloris sp. ZM17-4]
MITQKQRTLPPRARAYRRRGQALIEFMMVLPILLLLLLGLVGVGQVLLASYTVNQAARVGAHQGALAGGVALAASSAAEDVIDSGVGTDATNASIAVSCARTPCRRYDPITVQVSYAGELWVPVPGLMDRFSVRAEATRAAERDSQ